MKFHHLLLAALGLGLASCTLSEPEETAGAPEAMQLSEVRCFGLKVITIDRDSQNRITTLKLTNEERITLEYVGSKTTPSTIVITSWYEDYDNDDNATLVVDEETTWTNIQVDDNTGCIKAYDYSTTTRWNQQPENGRCSLTYNDQNQLVKETDTDGTVYNYTWENDCLTSISEQDGYNNAKTLIEYSDVENVNRQWDPMFEFKPLLNITGLFGSAPKKFAKQIQDEYGTNVHTAYALLPNGLIHHMKAVESDSEEAFTSVYNFVYESK